MKKTIMFLLVLSVMFCFSWHVQGKEKERTIQSITAQDVQKKRENYRWLYKQMEKIKAKCAPVLKMARTDSPGTDAAQAVDLQVVAGSISWNWLPYNDGSGKGDIYLTGLCENKGTTQTLLVIIFMTFYDNGGQVMDLMGGWVFSDSNVQLPLEEGVTFCLNSLEQDQRGFFQVLLENVDIADVDRNKTEESATFMYGYGSTGPLPPAHTQLTLDGALNFSSGPGSYLHIAGKAKNPSANYVTFTTIVAVAALDKANTNKVADATGWVVGDSSSPGYDFAVYPLESKPFNLYCLFTGLNDVSTTEYEYGFLYLEEPFSVSGDGAAPFGSFDTPESGSTVSGSIAVTGWALDDLCLASLEIYLEQGGSLFYLGDASFVEGARPDIEASYPDYPNNTKAGWGYMLLTNFLPDGGNGTYKLYAIAKDVAGKSTTLGTKTIICDNANAVKPFGAIDTPMQGGTISGISYTNWGWVLTPQPDMIATDGSKINVYVDGENLGHPKYNIYRADIAALFPGYANTDGAGGYYVLDTTAYADGVHTIQWTATDSGGDSDGIGSRYFSIMNDLIDEEESRSSALSTSNAEIPILNPREIAALPLAHRNIKVKKGYGNHLPYRIPEFADNAFHIEMKEVSRIEVDLGAIANGNRVIAGYQVVGDSLRRLPVGSRLNTERGVFYWQPGPGFLKEYQLVFIQRGPAGELSRMNIYINIIPR